jgi:UDP-3-O-[3-hydroxymyristoyl] glucosamine N-acyltransferase
MTKSFTLQQLADAVDGKLTGDGKLTITRLAHPADVTGAGDLALAMDAKLLPLLKGGNAAAAVISSKEEKECDFPGARIVVARPRVALAKLTALFATPVAVKPGIHPSAVIEKSAKVGKNACIGAQVYIGEGAVIGDNATLHPQSYIGDGAVVGKNAVIEPGAKIGGGTQIGDNVFIHFNASIGADGFSFVTESAGSVETAKAGNSGTVTETNSALIRIASLAPVIIGDDVEIGANSCIDRGTIVSTRIGRGTKIDNQVQIGHNVSIGENCMICGRVGIAGSVTIGNRVVLGGATGVSDHVTISDDAIVMAMSAVGGNVPAKTIVGGIPAAPREKVMEMLFNTRRLSQFYKKIEHLAERLEKLEKKPESD